jgi:hypothetical protein
MRPPKTVAAAWIGLLALCLCGTADVTADPILDVIDIRAILARHDIGNALGLAFNPELNVIYLAHGSDTRGGFVYTLDAGGGLLSELDLQTAYQPGAFPDSLGYDRSSGHLFVLVSVPAGQGFVSRVLEIDPTTGTIFRDVPIDIDGGGGIHIRSDGLWQSRFSEDVVRHYDRDAVFIQDVSVAASFPGFPGPNALTSSFKGGFFIVDHFGKRIVEVDPTGTEVAAASTAMLGDGRGLAIDSDVTTRRIFVQINNEAIYVLSAEFLSAMPTIVSIDIRPGRSGNKVKLKRKGKGKISVAILATDGFDATTVSPTTVRFGRTGTEAAPARFVFSDVNADGLTDLILAFDIEDTAIRCGDSAASLTGKTFHGDAIQGTDAITPVRCKKPRTCRTSPT